MKKSQKPLGKVFALAVLLTFTLSFPVYGQNSADVDSILKEIASALDEQKQIDVELQENLTLKREIESQYQAIEQEWDQYEAERPNYQSSCLGRELPEPEYNSCYSWWQRRENQRQSIISRIKSLEDRDEQRVQHAQSLKQRNDSIEARLQALKATLKLTEFGKKNQDCLSGSNEYMHQCMQNLWDGARHPDSF